MNGDGLMLFGQPGPQGPTGPTGPAGPPGPNDVVKLGMVEQGSITATSSTEVYLYAETSTHAIKRKRGIDGSVATMADSVTLLNYLPLSGGTLTGSINAGGSDITNAQTLGAQGLMMQEIASYATPSAGTLGIYAETTSERFKRIRSDTTTDYFVESADLGIYVQQSGSSVVGNLTEYSGANQISDSSIAASNVFLADGSVQATGTFDMNSNQLANVSFLNTINATAIVSNGGSSTTNNLALFSDPSGKTIADANISASNVFLADGSVAITGDVDMGNYSLTNAAAITFNTDLIMLGTGASDTGNNAVLIGTNASIGAGSNVCIGNNASIDANNNSTVIGQGASSSGGGNCVVLGAYASGTDEACMAIGSGAVNTVTHTCLIGDSGINNIRPNSSTCDLGTSGQPFQSLYASGSVVGPTTSRTVDSIVSSAGASTSGNLASFSDTTGLVIQDSGVVAANLVTSTGTSTTAHLASFADSSGKVIVDGWQTLPLLGWGLQTGGDYTTPTSILGAPVTFPANSTQRGSFIRVWGSLQVTLGTAVEVLTLNFNSSVGGAFGTMQITNNTGGGCNGRIMLDAKLFVMSGGFIHTSATLFSNNWWDPAIQVFLQDSESGTAWDETNSQSLDLQASFSVGTGSYVGFDNYYIEQVN
jgi:hypothetical protein